MCTNKFLRIRGLEAGGKGAGGKWSVQEFRRISLFNLIGDSCGVGDWFLCTVSILFQYH